jgi:hypothetical protein
MLFIELLTENQMYCSSIAFHIWFLLQLAFNTVKWTLGEEFYAVLWSYWPRTAFETGFSQFLERKLLKNTSAIQSSSQLVAKQVEVR